jgi:hypothetical protein
VVAGGLAELALGGYALPTLALVRGYAERWEVGMLRRLLSALLEGAPAPVSLAYALEVTRLVAALQARLLRQRDAAAAAGAHASSVGASVVEGGAAGRDRLAAFLSAPPPALSAAALARAAADAVAVGGWAVRDRGEAAAVAVAAGELTALLLRIDAAYRAHGVL